MLTLPQPVLWCIRRLEDRGFAAYAVGGCVRDLLLGLTPQDYDLCTDASPEQLQSIFSDHRLVLSGVKHGTVGVVLEGAVYEITTFRTEGDYSDGRHPGWVRFVPELKPDLARRDFTVNAMAYSPAAGLIDPFNGRGDLNAGILRTVGRPRDRFQEDALRILRGLRFALGYHLTPTPQTHTAMVELAPTLEKLARERVFDELCKLLPLLDAPSLCTYAPVLTAVIPELAPTVGFAQHSPHHIHDVFTHTAHVVARTPADLILRWAALLHDIGKPACFSLDAQGQGHFYGHAQCGAQMADGILRRLKSPTALREAVVTLIAQHMTLPEADKRLLRRRLSKFGPEQYSRLLALQEADHASTRPDRTDPLPFHRIRQLLKELEEEKACLSLKDLAVNGHDLLALGLEGPAIGRTLNRLLALVQDEVLPNEKEVLLSEGFHQSKQEELR